MFFLGLRLDLVFLAIEYLLPSRACSNSLSVFFNFVLQNRLILLRLTLVNKVGLVILTLPRLLCKSTPVQIRRLFMVPVVGDPHQRRRRPRPLCLCRQFRCRCLSAVCRRSGPWHRRGLPVSHHCHHPFRPRPRPRPPRHFRFERHHVMLGAATVRQMKSRQWI